MRDSRELTPFPVAGSRAIPRGRRRFSPLARDLIVILLIKAIVLGLLWFAFFRTPSAPRMNMDPMRVEQKLLSPAPLPEPAHVVR